MKKYNQALLKKIDMPVSLLDYEDFEILDIFFVI